jgi:hypothetical protein
VPARERNGIVNDDDQILITAGMLLADLGVAAFDEEPTVLTGSRQGRVVETNEHPPVSPGLLCLRSSD